MQRSSSGSRKGTGASSHRSELNRVIENRIYIGNSSGQPNLSQKLDDIKRQISRQYQKTFSTQRKQSTRVLRQNQPSVLNSRKVREVLARQEQQRYRQQYFELKDQYLNEKKEFVQSIERYNSLRSVIESYFRNPLEQSYISKLKEYYLSDNIDEYIEFVLELNRENEELKGHIERMLKIFQLHDFEDMIREITELLDRDRQQKARDYECQLDRLKFELLESQKQVRDYTKVVEQQHDQMKELSVELEAKRVLLREAQRKLSEEHRERIECQADLQRTLSERDTSLSQIDQLRREFEAFTDRIKELTTNNDKLKASTRRLESVVESQQKENVDLNRRVITYESEKNNFVRSMVESDERYQHLDNRLNKMIADYESSRAEWADQLRSKDRELSQLREQLTYEKISINRVCDLLRVVQQDEISERIKSLLNTEVQHSASQPLLNDFHKKMEQMLTDNIQLKEELAKTSGQRNEYKFVLANLNQDIVRLRREEQEKNRNSLEKQEQLFKEQERQLRKQTDTLQMEKKSAEDQLAFHKKQNDVLLARNDKLIKDLSAGEQANRSLTLQTKKLKEDLSNIYLQLKEIEELNGITSNKLKLSQDETNALRDKLERTESEMGRLIKQYQQEIQRKENDIAVSKEKCELALSNLETVKSEMAFRENDYKITVGKLTSDLESKCSLLSLTEEAHRRRLGEADKRYQQLYSEQSLLKDEIASLQRQLLLRDEESMELGRRLREEKATAEKDLERHKQKIEQLQFDVNRRQMQLEETNSQLKRLRRDKNEMSVKLLKSKSDEKQQLEQLQEEREKLQHELEAMTVQLEELQNRRDMDMESHRLQLQAENERKKQLQDAWRKSEKMLTETQQALSNWNAEHDQTVIELAQAQAYMSQMQATLMKKDDQIKQYSRRIVELEKDFEELQTKQQSQHDSWAKYVTPKTPARRTDSQQQTFEQEQRSPGMSSEEAEQLLMAMKTKEQTIGLLKQELLALQLRIDKLADNNRQLELSNTTELKNRERLESEAKDIRQQNQQLSQNLKTIQGELTNAHQELQAQHKEIQSLEKQLTVIREEFDQTISKVADLTDKLQEQRAEHHQDSDLTKRYNDLQSKYDQTKNKLDVLEAVYKQQADNLRKQQEQIVRKLEEELNEYHQNNEHLQEEIAQTSNLLADLNNTLDELKQNESKRVKCILTGLLNPDEERESRECLPYWPDVSDIFDELLAKMTRLKQNALEISVVEAPRTNRNLPSPTPSLYKEFIFERQKTDPVVEEPQTERIAELTHQLEELRAQNNLLRAQGNDAERNQQTFMMMQTELKQEIRELQRKNRELESNTNSQTVRTLKALFSKLLEALFTNNVTDLEEATRVILKILDYSTQEREDVHDNFEKRKKKKKGFFDIFK